MDDELENQAAAQSAGVTPITPVPQKSGGKGKGVLKVLLVLVLIAGAAYGVYYWQNQKVKSANAQVQQLNSQVSDLNKQVADAKAAASKSSSSSSSTKTTTTDDAVLAAAKAYCEASVDPTTKKALVFTAGTMGTDKKVVMYSTDKTFAQLTATCNNGSKSASTPYTLKKVNDTWVVVQASEGPDPDATKLYNIPTTFN